MAMGRRKKFDQETLFVSTADLPSSPGHPFYRKLNDLLAEAGFDRWAEDRCQSYYEQCEKKGRPSIPPGVYFRMLLVGYFEGIGSQRGIAWRCSDSLSLRNFLGLTLDQDVPDHSTLTNTRQRLPLDVFNEVFEFVLNIANEKELLSGRTAGVDSTMLEAAAAMKSIVRRDSGADWNEYVTELMRAEGEIGPGEKPSGEELRRFDRKRKKKVSNEDWVSPTDPDARIAKMKDGRTHLAYKAEHTVDLKSDLVVGAAIYPADASDSQTLSDSALEAEYHLQEVDPDIAIDELAADKGYHASATLEQCEAMNFRTYIPEPSSPHRRVWCNKPAEYQRVVYNNRRRCKREKGKRLQRLRSERCERSFAHVCDSGGMRRTWLRGIDKVRKRYLIAVAAHNLGRILFKLFGVGKPKGLQTKNGLASLAHFLVRILLALFGATVDQHPSAPK